MDMEQAKAAYQSLSEQERELIREAMDSPWPVYWQRYFQT